MYIVIVTPGPDVILLLGVETGAQGRIQIMPWAPVFTPLVGKLGKQVPRAELGRSILHTTRYILYIIYYILYLKSYIIYHILSYVLYIIS